LGNTDRDRRDPGDPTPCYACPKIPAGEDATPDVGRLSELTPENELVFAHYLRCKATGRFPEDGLVERHAGLIRMVEDQVDRNAATDTTHTVLAAIALLAARGGGGGRR
jgi:hypothetical protein